MISALACMDMSALEWIYLILIDCCFFVDLDAVVFIGSVSEVFMAIFLLVLGRC